MWKRIALAASIVVLVWTSPVMAAGDVEVEIDGGIAPLKGSLLVPDGDASVSAVLILPGSGPTDRNGNSPLGLATDAYRLVAAALAEQGIASLRMDKRGVAASAKAAAKEEDLRFETYVEDAVAWLAFLKRQRCVDRVVILGHSEGALVGALAAQRPGAAGFISLAGVGARAGDVLRRQLSAQLTGNLKSQALAAIGELEAGRTVANPPQELAALFRQSVQPYLISWFKIDPKAEIAKVKVPVLIVQGTTDIQVGVDDAKALAMAKPDAKLAIIDGMNHILRAAPMDRAQNAATYTNASLPLKSELMPALIAFIRGVS